MPKKDELSRQKPANLNNQDYFASKAFKTNTRENNLILLSAPSAAMILYNAVTREKYAYPIAQSHDIYVEETESFIAGTTILSMVTLAMVIAILTKEYPTLVT